MLINQSYNKLYQINIQSNRTGSNPVSAKNPPQAGIYIHIPFCKQACHYCNFHFSTSLKLKNEFIVALLNEIILQQDYMGDAEIETVYFGGGSPSILSTEEINEILEQLNKHFNINKNAEITLEANPDDINPGKVAGWKTCGINRLSIGIQSFFEEDLVWMNRAHNAVQAEECIKIAQDEGIDHLTIDLIYGVPGLTDEKWAKNIQKAIAMDITHISCYALTVEPKTPLEALIKKKSLSGINTDDQARQFLLLTDWLEAAGYEHYEISNFAKAGRKSRHNSSYWKGIPYLGLGPSAHSYRDNTRQWNVSNNALYIQSVSRGEVPFEKEMLSSTQQYNEYIMTAIRTSEGINLHYLNERFGLERSANLLKQIKPFIKSGYVIPTEFSVVLTREGKLFADGIASDLFIID